MLDGPEAEHEKEGDMKGLVIVIISLVLAGQAYAGYLFTEKNGNTFVWEDYEKEDGQYCTWLYAGKFCVPKESIASIKETRKGQTATKKVEDTKTKSYVPIYQERQARTTATASAGSSPAKKGAVVRRS
jgi:hypothetical protein